MIESHRMCEIVENPALYPAILTNDTQPALDVMAWNYENDSFKINYLECCLC